MAILVTCPCGRTLKVKDEHCGKRFKCPACESSLVVPSPAKNETKRRKQEKFESVDDRGIDESPDYEVLDESNPDDEWGSDETGDDGAAFESDAESGDDDEPDVNLPPLRRARGARRRKKKATPPPAPSVPLSQRLAAPFLDYRTWINGGLAVAFVLMLRNAHAEVSAGSKAGISSGRILPLLGMTTAIASIPVFALAGHLWAKRAASFVGRALAQIFVAAIVGGISGSAVQGSAAAYQVGQNPGKLTPGRGRWPALAALLGSVALGAFLTTVLIWVMPKPASATANVASSPAGALPRAEPEPPPIESDPALPGDRNVGDAEPPEIPPPSIAIVDSSTTQLDEKFKVTLKVLVRNLVGDASHFEFRVPPDVDWTGLTEEPTAVAELTASLDSQRREPDVPSREVRASISIAGMPPGECAVEVRVRDERGEFSQPVAHRLKLKRDPFHDWAVRQSKSFVVELLPSHFSNRYDFRSPRDRTIGWHVDSGEVTIDVGELNSDNPDRSKWTVSYSDAASGKKLRGLRATSRINPFFDFNRTSRDFVYLGQLYHKLGGKFSKSPSENQKQLPQGTIGAPGVVALSPDGSLLAGESRQGVALWNIRTSKLDRFLQHCAPRILSLAFSPDGQYLSGIGNDDNLILWRVIDGGVICRIPDAVHEHFTQADRHGIIQSFDPTGKFLATDFHNAVKLWSIPDGRLVHTLGNERDGPDFFKIDENSELSWGMMFHPDGTQLAVAHGNSVRLWDVADGELTHELIGPLSPIRAIAFSAEGKVLAAMTRKGFTVWSPEEFPAVDIEK